MAIPIEQALCRYDPDGVNCLARSEGFGDDWLTEAERLCAGFGVRPSGVACPQAVFAQPFGAKHVAVVQAADQADGGLAFRFLVLPRNEYVQWLGDPFVVADRFPPDWQTRGALEQLEWPAAPLPRRDVEATKEILKHGDSPTLLGGVQALVDGGRLVYERPAPATPLVRDLWALLPHSTRGDIWPASFAFANTLDFHALVVPRADRRDYAGYLTEEQAGDYPQGRYELDLQSAAESGDQAELDRLFYRRSSSATLRLALILVVVMALLALVSNIAQGPRRPRPAADTKAGPAPVKDRN